MGITIAAAPCRTASDELGFVTVEQECDPGNAAGSLADVRASREDLRSLGF